MREDRNWSALVKPTHLTNYPLFSALAQQKFQLLSAAIKLSAPNSVKRI
jgi:hypothetical protein